MNIEEQKERILEGLVDLLELPDSAYQTAKDRYEDVGEYLGRDESPCQQYDPHVFPQGSFRLGTAIRPLHQREEYDLDLACSLRADISSESHTQAELKATIGEVLESYRAARQIRSELEEKHRCWRLEYQDQISFHMDIVPCIPASDDIREALTDSIVTKGQIRSFANDLSLHAVFITDDRHPEYRRISSQWNISNPEGFALWFESRMRAEIPVFPEKKAQVDDLPIWSRKTSLQRCVQLLKRHRDQMFKDDPDVKPISIIITTLAGMGYTGQSSLQDAMSVMLDELVKFTESGSTFVPNPVNPEENFADRWTMPAYEHLKLRDNFVLWVDQARADFETLLSTSDVEFIAEQANQKFSVRPSPTALAKLMGLSVAPAVHTAKAHEVSVNTAKPWRTLTNVSR